MKPSYSSVYIFDMSIGMNLLNIRLNCGLKNVLAHLHLLENLFLAINDNCII